MGNRAACQANRRSALSRGLRVLGGVEHHVHDAVHVPVRWRQGANVDAQAACHGGAHRVGVEQFAFDLAGLENILGQRAQHRLLTQAEAQVVHAPEQPTLGLMHLRQ